MVFPFKVYVGCCLTGAPPEFVRLVEDFKQALSELVEVLHFLGLTAGTAANVFHHDIDGCVWKCDLFVLIGDLATSGGGYETATQVEAKEGHALCLTHRLSPVTRLLLGNDRWCYQHRYYTGNTREEKVQSMLEQAKAKLSAMKAELDASAIASYI